MNEVTDAQLGRLKIMLRVRSAGLQILDKWHELIVLLAPFHVMPRQSSVGQILAANFAYANSVLYIPFQYSSNHKTVAIARFTIDACEH